MRNDERQTDRKPGRKAEGSGPQRGIAIATIALFLGVLFICGILFWILPDKEKSEQENRMLQGLPEWTPKRFFDGDFGNEMNAYYADQFPARDFLVGVKGSTEFLLGNGVRTVSWRRTCLPPICRTARWCRTRIPLIRILSLPVVMPYCVCGRRWRRRAFL